MQEPLITCRTHWSQYVFPVLLGAFFILSGFSYFGESISVALIFIIIGLIVLLVTYLRGQATTLSISDGFVTGHLGILNVRELTSPISKVQDISLSSSFFGRIIGCYTICISTAGGNGMEYKFANIANAKEFQKKFMELQKAQ